MKLDDPLAMILGGLVTLLMFCACANRYVVVGLTKVRRHLHTGSSSPFAAKGKNFRLPIAASIAKAASSPFKTALSRGTLLKYSLTAAHLMSSATSSALNGAPASLAAAPSSEPLPPVEYFRKDYLPSPFGIPKIHMNFQLSGSDTRIVVTSTVVPTSQLTGQNDLVLDGEELTLISVKIDGEPLSADLYEVTSTQLRIKAAGLPNRGGEFQLETVVQVHPDKNLALSGLYKSGSSLLCTQCEAMGFRRIAYHLDRPDVLTRYLVRLEGSKAEYPILLSNGNNIDGGDLPDNRHWALWEDPFPKPSYLFALVAGDLASISSTYTTTSGKVVKLGIYSDKENAHKLDHAMYSIKESMKWDENTFGLECDLDVYNIVATNDFNMGAMENKGLNIFNSAYVLADPRTATDDDYERILGVIAHEYFHNWSGNRVTVRDWFQLTLKEGLTVFRDQWFSSDATSEAVKRIEDVRMLRSRQFAEDQGPMAHPIRPDSYISMDNFYTATVYVKGAEVVRLYRTLLGTEGFKKGLKLYFERHDGNAVTCDDFRNAMADANGVDLSQMDFWYSQAGTPIVEISQEYDPASQKLSIKVSQHIPSTPGQAEEEKKPLLIPILAGVIGKASGQELVPSTLLLLKEREQTFTLDKITEEPVLSALRGFSAPVKVRFEQSESELAAIMAFDSDSFNRWDAGNRLSSRIILDLAKLTVGAIQDSVLPDYYVTAVKSILTSCSATSEEEGFDFALIAYALQLPDLMTLSQEMDVINPSSLHAARVHVKKQLVRILNSDFKALYEATAPKSGDYVFSPKEVGRRRLRSTCLDFLSHSDDKKEAVSLAKRQFDTANCMTDKLAALACLVSTQCVERDEALASFYNDAAGDALVLNKWFSIQALADSSDILERVKILKTHPDFIISNPNRARSLLSVFAANMVHFHNENGLGYEFVADAIVELDALNPQVAARMASAFSQWKRFDTQRQELMKAQLSRIKATTGLSKDTFEVVTRCLK